MIGLIEGGGLFSLFSATRSIAREALAIGIDENALRTLFIAALTTPLIAVCSKFNISIKARLPSTLMVLFIVAGSLLADAVWGGRLISAYMMDHGYSRCVSADYAMGNGKSRVWFSTYVRSPNGCWFDRLFALRKKLPIRTGPITRLDHITLNRTYVTYSYTLIDRTGQPLEQQVADRMLRNSRYIKEGLLADVCANRFRNGLVYGLIENFGYSGKSGIVLMVSVPPNNCPPDPSGITHRAIP